MCGGAQKMKKYLLFLLILFVGLFSFACDDINNNEEESNNEDSSKEEKCVVSFYLDGNLYIKKEIDKNNYHSRLIHPGFYC